MLTRRHALAALGAAPGILRGARRPAGDKPNLLFLWTDQQLEASGAMDNTIVVFTSGHGEMLGSHSLVTKQVMYEESVRVPLLLRVPFRNQKPHRVTAPVSHIDTIPTLLALLGKRDAGQGQSLLPMLSGPSRRDGHVFIEWTGDGRNDGPDARTVISPDGYKLVVHHKDRAMLFDRNRDPREMHNLAGSRGHAPLERRLRAKIAEWQRATNDKLEMTA